MCYFTCIRDDVHRICHDDRSLLCGGTGSGRIYAGTDPVYDDPVSSVQRISEYYIDPDTSFFWIQCSYTPSTGSRFTWQCGFSTSGRMWCGDLLFYPFCTCTVRGTQRSGTEIAEKLKLLSDGLVQNWAMWITVIAFVVVVLLVNLLRTRSFDYAWRIAIIAGGVAYILVILAGDFCLDVTVSMVPMIISTVVSVLIGFVLEFFVYGGDYSRTERLEYEDDEYYYYVKAVPKASVATSEKYQKINAEPVREEKRKKIK